MANYASRFTSGGTYAWGSYTLYEGSAGGGEGAELALTIPLEGWNADYTLKISFRMPASLDDISSWDGLLGSDTGDHPYPYFNQAGLWFEIQNGPHPQSSNIALECFEAGSDYTVKIIHMTDSSGGDCFQMSLIEGPTTCATTGGAWCYDYEYKNIPQYAGCGYSKEEEAFSGFVTRVTFQGLGALDPNDAVDPVYYLDDEDAHKACSGTYGDLEVEWYARVKTTCCNDGRSVCEGFAYDFSYSYGGYDCLSDCASDENQCTSDGGVSKCADDCGGKKALHSPYSPPLFVLSIWCFSKTLTSISPCSLHQELLD